MVIQITSKITSEARGRLDRAAKAERLGEVTWEIERVGYRAYRVVGDVDVHGVARWLMDVAGSAFEYEVVP